MGKFIWANMDLFLISIPNLGVCTVAKGQNKIVKSYRYVDLDEALYNVKPV